MGKILKYYLTPHPPMVISDIGGGSKFTVLDTINAFSKISDEIATLSPKTIVILTPHGQTISNSITINTAFFTKGNFTEYGCNSLSYEFESDYFLAKNIVRACSTHNISAYSIEHSLADEMNIELNLDHGTLVPLHFIQQKLPKFKIVHIALPELPRYTSYLFGEVLRKCIDNTNSDVVVIASGDTSHKLSEYGTFGYSPSGVLFDNTLVTDLKHSNLMGISKINPLLVSEAYQCVLPPLATLIGCMARDKIKTHFLSYDKPLGIGYICCSFEVLDYDLGIDRDTFLHNLKKCNTLTNISDYSQYAIECIKSHLDNSTETISPPPHIENNGVFVSLSIDGTTHGCVGDISIDSNSNLADDIMKYSIEAGFFDPRYTPLSKDDLNFTSVKISLIENIEECSESDLDIYTYGIEVSYNGLSGIVLPNLPEVASSEEQIHIALSKAGICSESNYALRRFSVKYI